MFDPVPHDTFTIRIRLSDLWEWFKNLFSPKKASHLNMDYLSDSELDSDKSAASHKQIASALRSGMEMDSPFTPNKSHIFRSSDSEDEDPKPVVVMAAKNWLFSKLAALVLAIGEFIKNAANAIREHVESSSKQYEASIKAYGPTPMRGI